MLACSSCDYDLSLDSVQKSSTVATCEVCHRIYCSDCSDQLTHLESDIRTLQSEELSDLRHHPRDTLLLFYEEHGFQNPEAIPWHSVYRWEQDPVTERWSKVREHPFKAPEKPYGLQRLPVHVTTGLVCDGCFQEPEDTTPDLCLAQAPDPLVHFRDQLLRPKAAILIHARGLFESCTARDLDPFRIALAPGRSWSRKDGTRVRVYEDGQKVIGGPLRQDFTPEALEAVDHTRWTQDVDDLAHEALVVWINRRTENRPPSYSAWEASMCLKEAWRRMTSIATLPPAVVYDPDLPPMDLPDYESMITVEEDFTVPAITITRADGTQEIMPEEHLRSRRWVATYDTEIKQEPSTESLLILYEDLFIAAQKAKVEGTVIVHGDWLTYDQVIEELETLYASHTTGGRGLIQELKPKQRDTLKTEPQAAA